MSYMAALLAIVLASGGCEKQRASSDTGAPPVAVADAGVPDVTVDMLVYRIGVPAGEGGRSELRVLADGTATVDNEQAGAAPRHFEGRVSPETLASVVGKLDAAGLWSVQKRATAIPDEPPVEIEHHRGGTVRRVALWRNQLRDTDALRAVEAELDRLLRETSGGQAY